jgi:hypothetical protein
MILVLGHPDDSLIEEVRARLTSRGTAVLCLSEDELFSSTPFAFEQTGTRSGGYLRVNGTDTYLSEFSSVFVRMPRLWWAPTELDLQDQMFVYHESSAAWFALLASLSCRVVNRFDLAWWLNDITYPDALVNDLARRLEVHSKTDPPPDLLPPRIVPKMPDPLGSSVYVAGSAVIPREISDRMTADRVEQYLPALANWQQESGVQLCRLDFSCESEEFYLRHVEVFPFLHDEPTGLVEQIAGATVEMLA